MGASLFRREREIKKETLDFFKRRRYEGGGGRERDCVTWRQGFACL